MADGGWPPGCAPRRAVKEKLCLHPWGALVSTGASLKPLLLRPTEPWNGAA
jgi:hypothetical protein